LKEEMEIISKQAQELLDNLSGEKKKSEALFSEKVYKMNILRSIRTKFAH
jgi:hypothetical protein